jgi:hypothetical protein
MTLKSLIKANLLLLFFIIFQLNAQQTDSLTRQFIMDVEIRPRAEYTL